VLELLGVMVLISIALSAPLTRRVFPNDSIAAVVLSGVAMFLLLYSRQFE
jgi:hypothetical protein